MKMRIHGIFRHSKDYISNIYHQASDKGAEEVDVEADGVVTMSWEDGFVCKMIDVEVCPNNDPFVDIA